MGSLPSGLDFTCSHGVRSYFLLLLIQTQSILMHYIAYDPALFINGKRSVVESDTEDRKYLCRFHPCNEISKLLYEIFETSKKQDLTPLLSDPITFATLLFPHRRK